MHRGKSSQHNGFPSTLKENKKECFSQPTVHAVTRLALATEQDVSNLKRLSRLDMSFLSEKNFLQNQDTPRAIGRKVSSSTYPLFRRGR